MTKTIDITPSWAAAVEIYIAVLENPNAGRYARDAARSELQRLARAFDTINAERDPEPEPDASRWRAERRLERLEERDELDLY